MTLYGIVQKIISDRIVFMNFCRNRSNIIKYLDGMDSIIGEADLVDFYNTIENSLTESEEKTR